MAEPHAVTAAVEKASGAIRMIEEQNRPPGTRASILAEARDIPRSCQACLWVWEPGERRFVIVQADPACPWHKSDRVPRSPERMH